SKAVAGQPDDLALLRGQLPQGIAFGRARDSHPARSELRLRPLLPGPGPEPLKGAQGLGQYGLGVVDPAAPPEPFGVVEAKLCPLEWPLVPGGVGERLVEMGF